MNKDGILDALRTLGGFAGGYFVSKGYLNAADMTTLIGSVIGLASVGWSIWARSGSSKSE